VPFELQLYHKHPTPEYRILGCIWDLENCLRKNAEIFHRCTHAESDSRLLFKKWSKSVQDKWPKGRVALITKKQNPWGDFPHFSCVSAHCAPHLYLPAALREEQPVGIYFIQRPILRFFAPQGRHVAPMG